LVSVREHSRKLLREATNADERELFAALETLQRVFAAVLEHVAT
jgi:hypothetical protein